MSAEMQMKPCPFCGSSKVGIAREPDLDGMGTFISVKCQDCMGQSTQHFVSTGNECPQLYQEVRESWNRRSQGQEWMPIETAPKDGTYILLGARCGAWIGKYQPVYQSGFKPDNPWSSMMLNHDHMGEKWQTPTHWLPLPAAPSGEAKE